MLGFRLVIVSAGAPQDDLGGGGAVSLGVSWAIGGLYPLAKQVMRVKLTAR